MDLFSGIALLGVMLTLAAVPSASVALVVTRSATLGFPNGIAVALGIVLGDLVFVALALLGMGFLAEILGTFFVFVRYLGAAYLIYLGCRLLSRKRATLAASPSIPRRSLFASFAAGFLLTLGDIKAILFYASLFPAFVDPARLTVPDVFVIIAVTFLAVGGVKALYALAATRVAKRIADSKLPPVLRPAAGGLLLCTGGYLLVKP